MKTTEAKTETKIKAGDKVVQRGIGCIGEVLKFNAKGDRAFIKFGPYACDHDWIATAELELA